MSDPFASAKMRLDWADEDIQSIHKAQDAFFQTEPYTTVREQNARGLDELKIKLTTPIPPVITKLTVQAIEHLRATLDHIMSALGGKLGLTGDIYFPFTDSEADLKGRLESTFKGLPADIKARFYALKPYPARNGGNDLVWALHRVRRQTFHRLVRPVGSAASYGNASWRQTRPGPLTVYPPRWNAEKDELLIMETFRTGEPEYNIEVAFTIAFGEIEEVAGCEVLRVLYGMFEEVRIFLAGIEEASAKTGFFS